MPLRAFYGNSKGHSVYAIDVEAMEVRGTIPTLAGPYPVDRVAPDSPLLIASTRDAMGVSVINADTLAHERDVSLSHQPRSAKGNGAGLIAISGRDRPRTSLVSVADFSVVAEFGINAAGPIRDFGGALASGHEQWVAGTDRFFLVDRVHRTISLYAANSKHPVWTINSPTAVHHILPDPKGSGLWFAMAEGGRDALTPPSVMVLQLTGDQVAVVAHRALPIPAAAQRRAGAHHLDFHPNQPLLYIGSNEGMTYVLNKATLETIAIVPTGAGAGHTGFTEFGGKTFAVSVNHNAQFITVMDADNHLRIGEVQISNTAFNGTDKLQGHTTWVRGQFFYVMASADAVFIEVDLAALAIARSRLLPDDPLTGQKPFPMQGVFLPPPATARMPAGFSSGHSCTDCC